MILQGQFFFAEIPYYMATLRKAKGLGWEWRQENGNEGQKVRVQSTGVTVA